MAASRQPLLPRGALLPSPAAPRCHPDRRHAAAPNLGAQPVMDQSTVPECPVPWLPLFTGPVRPRRPWQSRILSGCHRKGDPRQSWGRRALDSSPVTGEWSRNAGAFADPVDAAKLARPTSHGGGASALALCACPVSAVLRTRTPHHPPARGHLGCRPASRPAQAYAVSGTTA